MIIIEPENLVLEGLDEPANFIVRKALAAALTADPLFQAAYETVYQATIAEILHGVTL